MRTLLILFMLGVFLLGEAQGIGFTVTNNIGDYNDYVTLPSGNVVYLGDFTVANAARSAMNEETYQEIGTNSHDYVIYKGFAGLSNLYLYAKEKATSDTMILKISYSNLYAGTLDQVPTTGIDLAKFVDFMPFGDNLDVAFVTRNGYIYTSDGTNNFQQNGNRLNNASSLPVINLISKNLHEIYLIQTEGAWFYKIITINGNTFSEQEISLGFYWRITGGLVHLQYDHDENIIFGTGVLFKTGVGPKNGAFMIDLNDAIGDQLKLIVETPNGYTPVIGRYKTDSLDGFILEKDAICWHGEFENGTTTPCFTGLLFVNLARDNYQIISDSFTFWNHANFIHQQQNSDKITVGGIANEMYFIRPNASNWENGNGLIEIDPTPPVVAITLDVTKLIDTLSVGESTQLGWTAAPVNIDTFNIIWTTSDPMIATVDSDGLVTGTGEGLVTISATDLMSGLSDFVDIYVEPMPVIIDTVWTESLNITNAPDSLEKGTSVDISFSQNPTNVTTPGVTWSVENITGQASINANGRLTGTSEGLIRVIVTSNDNGITDEAIMYIKKTDVGTSIGNHTALNVKIYPNPTTQFLIVEGEDIGEETFQIFNQLGQQVHVSVSKEYGKQIFNVSDLQTGIYLISNNSSQQRFVKN